jgi:two-component system, OmpR family, phosphate regulon response regulator PhoB
MFSTQTHKQILIVDRDVASVEALRHRLSETGFIVSIMTDGSAAAAEVAERPPHLVIIDWSIPGFAALEVIERARATHHPHSVRLIILSALCGEQHIVGGLNTGADDYIAKPFSLPEAVARVAAVLRTRTRSNVTNWALTAGRADASRPDGRREGLAAGGPAASGPAHADRAHLRSVEARLLEFLRSHPGRAFNRAQLLAHVWGSTDLVDERTVDVNIQRLRKFLSQPGHVAQIETVRGFGYRFIAGNQGNSSQI